MSTQSRKIVTLPRAFAGLALALAIAAVGGPLNGANAEPVVAASPTGESPVTADFAALLGPGIGDPVFTRSVYADAPRDLSTPAPAVTTAAISVAPANVVEAAPAPAPEPAPVAAPSGSLDEIINRYFGSEASRAKAIANCESKMNPNAVSPTNDHGLFQINGIHRASFERVTGASWSQIYNPELNTQFAHWMWSNQGWSPWTCSRKV